MSSTLYDELSAECRDHGPVAALERLAAELRTTGRWRELFTIRQMQVRLALGLPAIDSPQTRDLADPLRTQLEEGYLEACREVGRLFSEAGRIRDAWPYWNVIGDKTVIRSALEGLEVGDDNLTEVLEVALYEGVWPAKGVELLLRGHGTCNTITTLDGTLHTMTPDDRVACVSLLVGRVHADLLANVRYDIERREGAEPAAAAGAAAAAATLSELVASRDWLFSEGGYHLDTSHLSATVRLSKLLPPGDELRQAIDLCAYGRRLSSQFQFAGEEPFVEFYPNHERYLRAIASENVEDAIAFFRGRAETVDRDEHGTSAVEFYLALLDRVGQPAQAFEEAVRLLPTGSTPLGIAPSLLDLAQKAGRFDRLMQVAQMRDDPIGFAAGLMSAKTGES